METNNVRKLEQDLESGFNTKQADWTLFKTVLCEKMRNHTFLNTDSVQKQYDQFRKLVLEAAEISIPRKSNDFQVRYGNAWWNDACSIAVTNKRKAYHYYKRKENDENLENFKKAKYECKRVINQAKIKYLENYLENNVITYKDATKLWRKIQKIKNRYHLPEQPLVYNGIKTNSNIDKANILAECFAKNSQKQSLPKEIQDFRSTEESNLNTDDIPLISTSPNNLLFSKTELMVTLKQIQNSKKATGSDFISYDMIKNFPNNALDFLLYFFNRCYSEGTIPSQWTKAEVKALPKKGKKQSDPNNYRPISLTPHMSKVYERLIKSRLEYHFQKHNVIPCNQAGFKKARGCTDHYVKLSSNIKKSMSKGKPVLAVFFDVKKAFDSVWIEKVLFKLHKTGCDGYLFHAINCLLTNRSIYVKIGSSQSNTHNLNMGVPQGSVISPLIFNLMLSDINKVPLSNCRMTLYADDLTLWSTPVKFKNLYKKKVCMCIRNRLQENVNKILNYMKNTGFQLSSEKTTLIAFTGRHRIDKENLFISMNGIKIHPSSRAKYLGVIFDDHLNFKSHIEDMIKKTNCVWNILKSLINTPGGKYIPNLLKVIKALVRSKLSYGQEAYFSANKNVLKKLQIKECHFLRFALGLAPGTPQSLVYREANWLPLEQERRLRCSQYFFRSKTTKNSTSEELLTNYDDHFFNQNQPPPVNNRNSVQQCQPFFYYIHQTITKANLDMAQVNKLQLSPVPPWTLNMCSIDYKYLDLYTKHADQLLMANLAKEKIHDNFSEHLRIFTDGSKLDNGNVGCAFFIPDFNIKRQFRLNNDISIFSAELFAIYMALSYLNDIPRSLTRVVLLTDSKSVLQSFDNTVSKNRFDMQLECKMLIHQIVSKGIDLTLLWIPSHVGIRGNEIVDNEAKLAANKPSIDHDIGFSLTEIYSKLKVDIHKIWADQLREECVERNWIEFDCKEYPIIPQYLQPLFHRFRSCHLHNH